MNFTLIIMLVLLILGISLTIKYRFYQLRGFKFIIKNTVLSLFKKEKPEDSHSGGISSFQAVSTALAGTMGVGNIAGVATALVAGGPGAIFWMWVGAFFGMMTKYSEIYLAVKYRIRDLNGSFAGGPMYYMQNVLDSRFLAKAFAVLCILTSFGIGNITQINSVSTALSSVFNIPQFISGAVFMAVIFLIIVGGLKRIAAVNELLIPFISIIYIIVASMILFINRNGIVPVLVLIIKSAFSLKPFTGGLAGYTVGTAIKLGLSRGVFTNEAGLGSAPIAHSCANCKSPKHQAVWGIFEVFLDTIVVCTITALVILTADNGSLWQSGLDGSSLTSAAFNSVFSGFGEKFIAVSIAFYAVSAILGWCYYGESALKYLSKNGNKSLKVYRIIFIAFVFIGAVSYSSLVWEVSDILNCLMAIPNIIALFMLRDKVKLGN